VAAQYSYACFFVGSVETELVGSGGQLLTVDDVDDDRRDDAMAEKWRDSDDGATVRLIRIISDRLLLDNGGRHQFQEVEG
jgi:hypothetical protein